MTPRKAPPEEPAPNGGPPTRLPSDHERITVTGAELRALVVAAAIEYGAEPGTASLTADEVSRGVRQPHAAAATEPLAEWALTAPFRPLGHDRGSYFYLARRSGQVHELRAAGHDKKGLLQIARLAWWEATFAGSEGVAWTVAADACLRSCEREGIFRSERLHGRGVWALAGGTVALHLGDRIMSWDDTGRWSTAPDRYIAPGSSGDAPLFERATKLRGPGDAEAMVAGDARALLETFRALRWHRPASAALAAGWTVLAPVCGALPWRPHIFLVGDSGCGKSTILERLVVPLLADLKLYVLGATTEAGIRQELGTDGLPVVVDEAEGGEEAQHRRVQAVLTLARDASSAAGGRVAKGTVHGRAMTFRCRSMFCLASIAGAVKEEADKNRVAVLQLRGDCDGTAEEKAAHWRSLEPLLDRVTADTGRQLVARTLARLPRLLALEIPVFRVAATRVLGSARRGDQYGVLYAGAWTLEHDRAPTTADAEAMVGAHDLTEYVEDQVPAGLRMLQVLMDQRERVEGSGQPRTIAVGEMIGAVAKGTSPARDVSAEDCDRTLRQLGLRVDAADGVMLIAHTSEWIARALANTPYQVAWRTVLLGLPESRAAGQTRFHAGKACRATAVPLRSALP